MLIKVIDELNDLLGKVAIVSSAIIVFIQFIVVLLRYIFSINFIWLQESIMYGFSIMFLLSIALAYKHDLHVRIDIIYGKLNNKKKAVIELVGIVFMLIPMTIFLILFSWQYVASSWAVLETSNETTGIPFLFLLKTLIIVFAIQLLLQAISSFYKNYLEYKR